MKRRLRTTVLLALLAVTSIFAVATAFAHSVAPRFRIYSVSAGANGEFLISGSYPNRGGILRLVSEARTVRQFNIHNRTVSCASISPDGRLIASAGDVWATPCELLISNSMNGSVSRRLRGHNGVVMALAFSPDGKYLATGGGSVGAPYTAGELLLWNVEEGTILRMLTGHSGMIFDLAFSPNGKLLASASADTTIRIWSLSDGKQKALLSGHTDNVTSVSFDPSGERLASGSGAWGNPGEIRLWQTSDWQLEHTFAFKSQVNVVAFSPNGALLAAGGGHRNLVALCDLKGATSFSILESSRDVSDEVYSLAFTPDGARIAIGAQNETIAFRSASIPPINPAIAWLIVVLVVALLLAGLGWMIHRIRAPRAETSPEIQ